MTNAQVPRTLTLDVRPLLARGDEPFQAIMEAVDGLGPSDHFVLVSPFLPSPLIDILQSRGFSARPERQSDGTWETRFVR